MSPFRLKQLLWGLVFLSLIPGLALALRRIGAEGHSRQVTLLMDERALAEQADLLGQSSFELGRRYQSLGLNGIALYEETLDSLAAKGRIAMLTGTEARSFAVARGDTPPAIPADSTLVRELTPGALDDFLAKNRPPPREVELSGTPWLLYPGGGNGSRPAGPDRQAVSRWAEAGFDIAYRPRNFPNLEQVGEDFPPEAHYLVHAGLQVAGHPNNLDEVVDASQGFITGIIEGTEQDGMEQIARRLPTTRLLSFNQDYINRRLHPGDLVDKFMLAANERGIRLLYLRPYTEEQLGDMVDNTEALIRGLTTALKGEGFAIGPLPDLELDYRSNGVLRALSAVGILAGLGLLVLLYPGVWGPLMATLVLGLGLLAGGFDWDALALVAALVFPVIGYGHLPRRLSSLGLATLVSLIGATLLAAVGSDREAMLAISPFAGVAATLIVPPGLFLLHSALRHRPPAVWIRELWGYPLRLGDVVIVLVGVAALAVVFLRRGNFQVIGVSGTELTVRNWLSGLFVRPRFKELLGHPLALLALSNRSWPSWAEGLLLTGGVIGQASILNSFSHYHTPLLISLQRSLIALVLGFLLGLLLTPLVRFTVTLIRGWLAEEVPAGT